MDSDSPLTSIASAAYEGEESEHRDVHGGSGNSSDASDENTDEAEYSDTNGGSGSGDDEDADSNGSGNDSNDNGDAGPSSESVRRFVARLQALLVKEVCCCIFLPREAFAAFFLIKDGWPESVSGCILDSTVHTILILIRTYLLPFLPSFDSLLLRPIDLLPSFQPLELPLYVCPLPNPMVTRTVSMSSQTSSANRLLVPVWTEPPSHCLSKPQKSYSQPATGPPGDALSFCNTSGRKRIN